MNPVRFLSFVVCLCVGFWSSQCNGQKCPHFNSSGIDYSHTYYNSTAVKIQCKVGVPFRTVGRNLTHPIAKYLLAICEPNGKWRLPVNTVCWEGLHVDISKFEGNIISLPTMEPVILTCENPDLSKYKGVVLRIGHRGVEGVKMAWANITFNWKYDGLHVRCEYERSSSKMDTTPQWKKIDLQYEAGFERRAQSFKAEIGKPRYLFIYLHSKFKNITHENIKIMKDGKEVGGYYVDKYYNHRQLITKYFNEVRPSDLGDYTIILNNPGHEQVTELIKLTGDTSAYNKKVAITAVVAVICVIFVIILVVSGVCCYKKYFRSKEGSDGCHLLTNSDDVFLSNSNVRHTRMREGDDNARYSIALSNADTLEYDTIQANEETRVPIEVPVTNNIIEVNQRDEVFANSRQNQSLVA